MRIAVDMDEVLADAHGGQWALYAARGYRWSDDQCAGVELADLASAAHAEEVQQALHDGDFFADLAVIEGAAEGLQALTRAHEVFIATAALEYPASLPHKFRWLRRHFPFIDPLNIVFCGDKSIIAADILIDDRARHFERFGGTGVLFSAPHNAGQDWPHRLERWADSADLIEGLAR